MFAAVVGELNVIALGPVGGYQAVNDGRPRHDANKPATLAPAVRAVASPPAAEFVWIEIIAVHVVRHAALAA